MGNRLCCDRGVSFYNQQENPPKIIYKKKLNKEFLIILSHGDLFSAQTDCIALFQNANLKFSESTDDALKYYESELAIQKELENYKKKRGHLDFGCVITTNGGRTRFKHLLHIIYQESLSSKNNIFGQQPNDLQEQYIYASLLNCLTEVKYDHYFFLKANSLQHNNVGIPDFCEKNKNLSKALVSTIVILGLKMFITENHQNLNHLKIIEIIISVGLRPHLFIFRTLSHQVITGGPLNKF